jgi:hypothetical protein
LDPFAQVPAGPESLVVFVAVAGRSVRAVHFLERLERKANSLPSRRCRKEQTPLKFVFFFSSTTTPFCFYF